MIKYAHVFDMRFICRVLHNFTFRDNFACFSYVHGLPRDVEDAVLIRLVKSSNLSWLKRPDLTPSYESRQFHHFEWWYFDEGDLKIVDPRSCSSKARRK